MNKLLTKGIIVSLLILSLTLSACGAATPTEDPVLKITQIASTVIAEMTQVAALTPSATPTLEPTATATMVPPTATKPVVDATSTPTARPVVEDASDDDVLIIEDVTYPDGAIVKGGSTITKIWKVKNTGQNVWLTAYRLSYVDGLKDAKEVLYIHIPYQVRPNEMVELSVDFNLPANGRVTSYWRMVNVDGKPFGPTMWMDIIAGEP